MDLFNKQNHKLPVNINAVVSFLRQLSFCRRFPSMYVTTNVISNLYVIMIDEDMQIEKFIALSNRETEWEKKKFKRHLCRNTKALWWRLRIVFVRQESLSIGSIFWVSYREIIPMQCLCVGVRIKKLLLAHVHEKIPLAHRRLTQIFELF